MNCKVDGCGRHASSSGICKVCRRRLARYGRLHKVRREKGTFTVSDHGYRKVTVGGRQVYEHRLIAEKATGKPLPEGAVVILIDGDRSNIRKSNIIVCPDKGYAEFIRSRLEAMKAEGDPSKRKCNSCGEWDFPANMYCYAHSSSGGYRFKHQVSNFKCISSPIPEHKIPFMNNGRKRHYHWRDYLLPKLDQQT